jgi:O-antigen/teichoic acid export membrane protein
MGTGRALWTRVWRGSVAILCGHAITIVSGLVTVPLLLSIWEPAVYGEWLALLSVVAYLTALDLGLNTAATNRLTQAYARHELEAYRRYQQSGLVFYGSVALLGAVILGAVVWWVPVPRWLGITVTDPVESGQVLWLLGVQILLLMPVGFLMNAYRTMGNLAHSQWIGNARQIGAFVLMVVTVMLGGGMTAIALSQIVPVAAVGVFVLLDLRRRHPEVFPGLKQARVAAIRDLVRPSLLFLMMALAGALALQGSVVLVSGCLGGLAVGLFVTSRTLVSLARQIAAMVRTALWPDLTALDARGDRARLRILHRIVVIATSTLVLVFGTALWMEGAEAIGVWTRWRLEPDPVLIRLLVLQAVLQAPWQASGALLAAFNQHRAVAWAHLASSAIGLGVAWALIDRWGVWAVPTGLIIGEAIACYHVVPRETCRRIGEPYGAFALRQWSVLALLGGLTFAAAWLAHQVANGPTVLRWLQVGAATLSTGVLAAWFFGLRSEDRLIITRALKPLAIRSGGRVAVALRTL